MRLWDLLLQEYLAIMTHLIKKIATTNNQIIINSTTFYTLLDKNLYLKRREKLKIYRQLNFITCNSKGFTSVIYDKESHQTKRKIVLNLNTYQVLKELSETEIKGVL